MIWWLRRLRRLRWRHLQLAPLALVVVASELLFRHPWLRRHSATLPADLHWRPGVSVVIPERGGARMLRDCLHCAERALAQVRAIGEPYEIIVVVNGSASADYAALAIEFPAVRWRHIAQPLGFTSAVLAGLEWVQHGAIYLLNNDMLLHEDALVTAMRWRQPRVFGIASQIFFQDAERRREETGWTAMRFEHALPHPWHVEPIDAAVRGTVWAGAGAALFHAETLRRLMPGCLPFDPFYWEDVDLGVRAWRVGYENLFCPASIAHHRQRATVERFYPAAEVARVFERNRLLFQLRNPFPVQSLKLTLAQIARLDAATAKELGGWRACLELLSTRWRALHAPCRDLDYPAMWSRRYGASHRLNILWVTPFAILPPRHGGAVRSHALAQALAQDFDLILLSDEAEAYSAPDCKGYLPFVAAELVSGRPPTTIRPGIDLRSARRISHAHRALRTRLRQMLERYRPVAVMIEHAELAALVMEKRAGDPAFLLSLHDVLLSPGDPAEAAADAAERSLIERFDSVIVCSPEDQALLGTLPALLVANGCHASAARAYVSSAGNHEVLFVGPFRAPNNRDGISRFLAKVWPQVSAAVPTARLVVVGGPGASAQVNGWPGYDPASVTVLDHADDLTGLLRRAALTINPQPELRGSSIKVIEALAAGRICVSTQAGARGHQALGFKALITVRDDDAFAQCLIELLADEAKRIALEQPQPALLERCDWSATAMPLRELLQRTRNQLTNG